MKKIIVIVMLLLVSGCSNKSTFNEDVNSSIKNDKEEDKVNNLDEIEKTMDIKIGDEKYNVILEDNETTKKLLQMLPLTLPMEELNGNEKYYYLDETLPNNPNNLKKINKGDIMLYNNNCLVIFYKSFETTYKYTKIGKIENPDNLDKIVGKGNIDITFEQ